jgi:hypothetical protein
LGIEHLVPTHPGATLGLGGNPVNRRDPPDSSLRRCQPDEGDAQQSSRSRLGNLVDQVHGRGVEHGRLRDVDESRSPEDIDAEIERPGEEIRASSFTPGLTVHETVPIWYEPGGSVSVELRSLSAPLNEPMKVASR